MINCRGKWLKQKFNYFFRSKFFNPEIKLPRPLPPLPLPQTKLAVLTSDDLIDINKQGSSSV